MIHQNLKAYIESKQFNQYYLRAIYILVDEKKIELAF